MHNAHDILSKYEEANDNLSRQQILEAMQEYADICVTQTHDLLTSADYLLAPIEDLYREEHPSPCFFIPCRHKLFKWIAEKLTENKTFVRNWTIVDSYGREVLNDNLVNYSPESLTKMITNLNKNGGHKPYTLKRT